ncbi:MAG: protein-L-isoaspartate O-methyltransferase [Pseudomonadota bacterium]|jgi:protein-L-isoaspartate(D-aspartate) O-methyltransferase
MNEQRRSGIGMTSARTRDRLVQRLIEQGIRNREVLECIRSTPRHLFIDEALSSRAYEDTALPIGFGQTISQPYIVARMTEALLEVGPLHNVLEVGTGCGYQTAILAALVPRLHSIERIEALHLRAQQRLQELGATHVRLRHGDGYEGWRANAPYDGILVAAAPPEVPEALLRQLAPGGRLVMPVGDDRKQVLLRVTRRDGGYEREMLGPVSFVPLQSGLVSDTGTAGR